MDVSIRQAADLLALTPRRVRAMIAAGRLPARHIDDRIWLVDTDDVRRLLARHRPSGRPLSARSVWAVLDLAEGAQPVGLSASELGRARRRLADLASVEPGELAKRAAVQRFRAHPGVRSRLEGDPRLLLSGVSAAGEHGADIVAFEVVEGYTRADDLPALMTGYALQAVAEGKENVIIRVPALDWPFDRNAPTAPAAVCAVDLIDAGDERSVRAGRVLLARIVAARGAS